MATTQSTYADTEAQISGQAVISLLDGAAGLAPAYRDRALDLLDGYGIPDPRGDQWYEASRFQHAVAHLAETAGPATVSRLGMALADVIGDSTGITSTGEALAQLEEVYQRLHRGEAGTYDVELTGDRSAAVSVRTPYPDAFDRGLLKGLGYAFSDGVPRVTSTDASRDGQTQTYEMTW